LCDGTGSGALPTLSKAESHYSATELEALVIASALKHFSAYLYGNQVDIHTDHKSLMYLHQMVNGNKRLIRLATVIEQFHHTMHYVPGKDNQLPDALSRSWDIEISWTSLNNGGDIGHSLDLNGSYDISSTQQAQQLNQKS